MDEKTILDGQLIITPFLKAHQSLIEALDVAKTDLEKAGAIQRFEYCYELSWKFMKRVLTVRGIEVNSPREVFREAAREKLITDPEIWFEFLKKRNLTVHTYNEEVVDEIFASLRSFESELTKLKQIFEAL